MNGRDPEALKNIETALAFGIHDAKILRHAGEIALAAGNRAAAERYLNESAQLNAPGSSHAREVLASLLKAHRN